MKEFLEEVKDYLDIDIEKGDVVRCLNCGELILHQVGGTVCPNCDEENFEHVESNVTREELTDKGYILCDI